MHSFAALLHAHTGLATGGPPCMGAVAERSWRDLACYIATPLLLMMHPGLAIGNRCVCAGCQWILERAKMSCGPC
jgi:hypothetical protein